MSGTVRRPPLAVVLVAIVMLALGETAGAAMSRFKPEIQRYAADMRSITQGRGYYSMSFSHYEEVPAHLSQKIVDAAQAAREAARA